MGRLIEGVTDEDQGRAAVRIFRRSLREEREIKPVLDVDEGECCPCGEDEARLYETSGRRGSASAARLGDSPERRLEIREREAGGGRCRGNVAGGAKSGVTSRCCLASPWRA